MMSLHLLIVIPLLLINMALAQVFKPQHVHVTGKAFCAMQHNGSMYQVWLAPNATVELYEQDPVWDDLLATTRADESGSFQIEAEQFEPSSISPYLRISHACYMPEFPVIPELAKRCRFTAQIDIPHRQLATDGGYRSEHNFDPVLYTDAEPIQCS